jgi:hypothetical protein
LRRIVLLNLSLQPRQSPFTFSGRFTSPRDFFSEGEIATRILADYKESIARQFLNKIPRAALQILRLRCDIYVGTAHNLSDHSNLKRMAG